MKLIYIACLSICAIISSFAQASRVCVWDKKEIDIDDPTAMKGKTGVIICGTEGSSVMELALMLKDGIKVKEKKRLFDGRYIEYDLDKHGNKTGFVRTTTEKGKLLIEENYVNGEAKGWATEYFENQKLKRRYFYEAGQTIFEACYDERGNITNLVCADKDLKGDDSTICGWKGPNDVTIYKGQGLSDKYTMLNGKISNSMAQVNKNTTVSVEQIGKNQNLLTIKRKNEGLIKIEVKENRPNGTSNEYDKDGNLLTMATWKEGKQLSETKYYLNRRIKSQLIFNPSRNQIDFKSYSENNILIEEASFVPRYDEERWEGLTVKRFSDFYQYVGPYKYYFEDGILMSTKNYNKDSKLDGDEIIYFHNGQPERINSYKNGDLFQVKKFDETGKVLMDNKVFKDGSIRK